MPERFLALGDSFTIGTGTTPDRSFPAVLTRIWNDRGRQVVLANPAVNGYTTDDLIEEELSLVAWFRPTLVTLLIGANDIVRGESEDRYGQKLRSIHERIRDDAPVARVVALPQPDWSLSPAGSGFGDVAV
ncbi:MAG TPA: SGNH/GDSL hydrolase family protein, partial [Candidatus Limnocylindria bacterium]|nr:SGNH/GDSL hydrolase family protein [Candidatus Limnocylindria bacterium]